MVDDVKWDMVPLGLVAEFHTGWTPPSGDDRYYGGSHKWANISDVGTRHLYDTERTISDFALEKQPGARLALPGDLLFPFKLSIGAVSFACEEMYTNEAIAVFPPNEKFDLRFAYYAFPYFLLKNAGVNIYGAPLLNSTLIKQARVPSPPLETQQCIADYLDRETAEIDAAVADLDKYVELLEKRKLSKIESALNAISYQMCPVGLLADVTLGKMVSTTPPKAGGLERQYLRAAHVQPGGRLDFTVAEKKMWFSEKELERLDLLTGDVVVVEGGAGFGRSAYLESDLEGWGFQNSINRVRVDSSKADGRFVHLMLSRALLNGSIGISVDTATLPHFTAEKLARFRIPTCEIHKQKQLSHEVHKDILTANNLIAESMKLRNLLLKRRSVLITEVVTGRKQV